MKYQLRYLLHQLEHRKVVQVQTQGLVEEWLFPLEKSVRLALEHLESPQVVQDLRAELQAQAVEQQLEAQDEAQAQVVEEQGLDAKEQDQQVLVGQLLQKVKDLELEWEKARLRVSELEMALELAHSKVWWKE